MRRREVKKEREADDAVVDWGIKDDNDKNAICCLVFLVENTDLMQVVRLGSPGRTTTGSGVTSKQEASAKALMTLIYNFVDSAMQHAAIETKTVATPDSETGVVLKEISAAQRLIYFGAQVLGRIKEFATGKFCTKLWNVSRATWYKPQCELMASSVEMLHLTDIFYTSVKEAYEAKQPGSIPAPTLGEPIPSIMSGVSGSMSAVDMLKGRTASPNAPLTTGRIAGLRCPPPPRPLAGEPSGIMRNARAASKSSGRAEGELTSVLSDPVDGVLKPPVAVGVEETSGVGGGDFRTVNDGDEDIDESGSDDDDGRSGGNHNDAIARETSAVAKCQELFDAAVQHRAEVFEKVHNTKSKLREAEREHNDATAAMAAARKSLVAAKEAEEAASAAKKASKKQRLDDTPEASGSAEAATMRDQETELTTALKKVVDETANPSILLLTPETVSKRAFYHGIKVANIVAAKQRGHLRRYLSLMKTSLDEDEEDALMAAVAHLE